MFDRDKHTRLPEALKMAKDNGIKVALSSPCFEFWYLLHFAYTSRDFASCSEVISLLEQEHLHRDNDKRTAPPELFDLVETAVVHAERLRTHNDQTGTQSPSTDADRLVTELLRIRAS